jgi:hypothetical protein
LPEAHRSYYFGKVIVIGHFEGFVATDDLDGIALGEVTEKQTHGFTENEMVKALKIETGVKLD